MKTKYTKLQQWLFAAVLVVIPYTIWALVTGYLMFYAVAGVVLVATALIVDDEEDEDVLEAIKASKLGEI